jgi:hypothetical protein
VVDCSSLGRAAQLTIMKKVVVFSDSGIFIRTVEDIQTEQEPQE